MQADCFKINDALLQIEKEVQTIISSSQLEEVVLEEIELLLAELRSWYCRETCSLGG